MYKRQVDDLGLPYPDGLDVQYDSTIHPGTTTQTYDVVASDMNMNFLNMNSKYSIDQLPSDADFKLFYGGLASYTDLVGMDWRYWACQNGGAGPCASQCRSGVCQMRAEFTGFDCGLTSWLSVTGGSKLSTSTGTAPGRRRTASGTPTRRSGPRPSSSTPARLRP